MATMKKLQDKKEADRRTGLLGLAADRQSVAGECLTSEEMALLVDRECDEKRERQFLDHIASCSDCYGEWSSLRGQVVQNSESQAKGKQISFFSFAAKPRVLVMCGSVLAVAVSIAIVLNISFEQALITSQDADQALLESKQEKQSEKEELRRSAPGQSQKAVVAVKKFDSEASAPAQPKMITGKPKNLAPSQKAKRVFEKVADKSVLPRNNGKGMIRGKSDESVVQQEKMVTDSSYSTSGEKQKQVGPLHPDKTAISGRVANAELQEGERFLSASEPKVLTIDHWLEQVKKGCLEKRKDVLFWKRLSKNGKAQKTQGQRPTEENKKLTEIIDSIVRMESTNVDERCAEILHLLDQNKGMK